MAVPSTQLPLPLTARRDLKTTWLEFHGRPHVLVKDPVGLQYYRLLPVQHRLLELLDGRNSWDDIYETLHAEFRDQQLTRAGLQQLIFDLHEKDLTLSTREGLAAHIGERRREERWRRLRRLPSHLMFFKLPGWNADLLLRRLAPLGRILFSPVVMMLCGLLTAGAWVFLLVQIDQFQRQLPTARELFDWRNILLLWLSIGAAKAIHELAHAMACRRWGGECHEIGVAFLIFSPCLYCDVSDSWMMSQKSRRIAVALAGIWVELMLSAICIVLWWQTAPGVLHSLSLQLIIVTSVSTVLFNANPLLRYDGYYVLADLLEVPNLQQRGQHAVRQAIARTVFGVRLPRDPFGEPGRFGLYLTYGICSGLYRWMILLGIGLFLHEWLKPYGLQGLALIYLVLSIVASLAAMGLVFWRILMHVRVTQTPALLRSLIGMSACGGLLFAIWHVPIRDHERAPVLIEPHGLQHVYAELPGELEEIHVAPGDTVSAGSIIARLRSLDVEQRLIELAGELQKLSADLALANVTANPDLAELVTREIRTLASRQHSQEQQQRRLSIIAPCAGRVISTPNVLGGPSRSAGTEVSGGIEPSLLDRSHQRAHIPRRTQLCSIAPDDLWQAVAWIDQDQCRFLKRGQTVEVMLTAYPGQRIAGRIESISRSDDHDVPAPLTHQRGGDLMTQSTPEGESPREATYRVVILLEESPGHVCLGMRGDVRYVRTRQSLGEWLKHSVRETFLAL